MATPIQPARSANVPRCGFFRSRVVWGCLAGPLVLAVVLAVIVGSWWVIESRRAARELAVEVDKVRSRGEPLTTVELDDFYTAAPGRPDMTREMLGALTLCESPELKALAKNLPVVGTGPEIPDPPETWSQLEEVEAYLARHQPALDVFHEVARRDATARYPVDMSVGAAIRLPHVQTIRHAVWLLSLDCRVQLHRGRPQEAVQSIEAQLGLLRTLEREPVLVTQLVRVAGHSLAVGNLAMVIRFADVSDDELSRVRHRLGKINPVSDMRTALSGERAVGYMGCIDPLLMNSRDITPTPEQARLVAQRPPQRVFDAAMMLRNNTRMVEALKVGLLDARRTAVDVETELKLLAKRKPENLRYIMTLLLTPATYVAVEAFARSAAHRDTADAAIAAELYRRRTGAWPPDLESLVPEFLPEAPLDPFTNMPLIVISTPAKFKVYSVGKNLKDDGGDFSQDFLDVGFAISLRTANGH